MSQLFSVFCYSLSHFYGFGLFLAYFEAALKAMLYILLLQRAIRLRRFIVDLFRFSCFEPSNSHQMCPVAA